jgi:hypothetical protein
VAYAQENFSLDGKGVGAALKAGQVSVFDPADWDKYIELLKNYKAAQEAPVSGD